MSGTTKQTGKRRTATVIMVLSALLVAGSGIANGIGATTASETVYLGTDKAWTPSYSSCTYDGDGSPDCNSGTGTMKLSMGSADGYGSIYSAAKMFQNYDVVKRCSAQSSSQTAEVRSETKVWGNLQRGGVFEAVQVEVRFSPDGSARETEYSHSASVSDGEWVSEDVSSEASVSLSSGNSYQTYTEIRGDIATTGAYNSLTFVADPVKSMAIDFTDTSAPSRSIDVSADNVYADVAGDTIWYSAPATVEYNANDGESCVKTHRFRLDYGGWHGGNPGYNQDPFYLYALSSGAHTAQAYAINYQNMQSSTLTWPFDVDGTNPDTEGTLSCNMDSDGNCVSYANYEFDCADGHSGCAGTWYRVDDGNWQQGTSTTVTGTGDHTVYWYSKDNVDNREDTESDTVTIVSNCLGICLPVEISRG